MTVLYARDSSPSRSRTSRPLSQVPADQSTSRISFSSSPTRRPATKRLGTNHDLLQIRSLALASSPARLPKDILGDDRAARTHQSDPTRQTIPSRSRK